MSRVKTAIEAKDTKLAIELLDAVVELKPDYVEAWNRRATLYFVNKDYGKSLADLRQVLAREPRHFGGALRPRRHHAGVRRGQACAAKPSAARSR